MQIVISYRSYNGLYYKYCIVIYNFKIYMQVQLKAILVVLLQWAEKGMNFPGTNEKKSAYSVQSHDHEQIRS